MKAGLIKGNSTYAKQKSSSFQNADSSYEYCVAMHGIVVRRD